MKIQFLIAQVRIEIFFHFFQYRNCKKMHKVKLSQVNFCSVSIKRRGPVSMKCVFLWVLVVYFLITQRLCKFLKLIVSNLIKSLLCHFSHYFLQGWVNHNLNICTFKCLCNVCGYLKLSLQIYLFPLLHLAINSSFKMGVDVEITTQILSYPMIFYSGANGWYWN